MLVVLQGVFQDQFLTRVELEMQRIAVDGKCRRWDGSRFFPLEVNRNSGDASTIPALQAGQGHDSCGNLPPFPSSCCVQLPVLCLLFSLLTGWLWKVWGKALGAL